MPSTVTHLDRKVDWILDYLKTQQHGGPPIAAKAKADMSKIHVMDFLTNNGDRHPKNLMISPAGDRVLAIDHGYALHYGKEDKPGNYDHSWNVAGEHGERAARGGKFGRSGLAFWEQNRDKIRAELPKHLSMLHPVLANQILTGFEGRAKLLDKAANNVKMGQMIGSKPMPKSTIGDAVSTAKPGHEGP
jgi:hypothetical protein